MFKNIGLPEILIVALVVLILFGSSKIPEFAKGIINFVKEIKQSFKDGTSSK
jgi:sec-independent protein translocase protein TatA